MATETLWGRSKSVCRLRLETGAASLEGLIELSSPCSGTRLCTHEQHLPGAADPAELVQGAVTSTSPYKPKGLLGQVTAVLQLHITRVGPPCSSQQRQPWGLLQTGPWAGGAAQSSCSAPGRIFRLCEVEEGTESSSLERQEPRLLLLSHLLGGNFAIWQPTCSTHCKPSMVESRHWAPF